MHTRTLISVATISRMLGKHTLLIIAFTPDARDEARVDPTPPARITVPTTISTDQLHHTLDRAMALLEHGPHAVPEARRQVRLRLVPGDAA